MAEPETDDLRVEQIRRERAEHDRASAAQDPAERRQHARRADKAAYLRAKLDERAEAEERVQREP